MLLSVRNFYFIVFILANLIVEVYFMLFVQNILRCLFCLGLFARYGAEFFEAFEDEDINMNKFLELYKFFLGLDDFDIKTRALQVGFKPSIFSELSFRVLHRRRMHVKERSR